MTRDLQDRLVLITGGARGIGLATARRFAAAGSHVVLGDVDEEAARAAARLVGGRTVGLPLDVADRASFRAFVDAAQQHGDVEVLVNNAGIMPLSRLVDEADEATDRILDINVGGVITGTKLVLPGMLERRRGHIINIASAVGRVAVAGGATYSASKFAVVGFSEAVQAEVAPSGVDVSCVLPTVVDTELAAGVEATRGMRAVRPEEVADAVVGVARSPRFETWVPAWSKGLYYVTNGLPRRVRNGAGRALGADRALSGADMVARADYERRASS